MLMILLGIGRAKVVVGNENENVEVRLRVGPYFRFERYHTPIGPSPLRCPGFPVNISSGRSGTSCGNVYIDDNELQESRKAQISRTSRATLATRSPIRH